MSIDPHRIPHGHISPETLRCTYAVQLLTLWGPSCKRDQRVLSTMIIIRGQLQVSNYDP